VFFSSKVNPELFGGELLIIYLVSMTFKEGCCFAGYFPCFPFKLSYKYPDSFWLGTV